MRNEKIELHTKPFLALLYILYFENLGLGLLVRRHDYQLVRQELGNLAPKTEQARHVRLNSIIHFPTFAISINPGSKWHQKVEMRRGHLVSLMPTIPLLSLAPSPIVESCT